MGSTAGGRAAGAASAAAGGCRAAAATAGAFAAQAVTAAADASAADTAATVASAASTAPTAARAAAEAEGGVADRQRLAFARHRHEKGIACRASTGGRTAPAAVAGCRPAPSTACTETAEVAEAPVTAVTAAGLMAVAAEDAPCEGLAKGPAKVAGAAAAGAHGAAAGRRRLALRNTGGNNGSSCSRYVPVATAKATYARAGAAADAPGNHQRRDFAPRTTTHTLCATRPAGAASDGTDAICRAVTAAIGRNGASG